MGFFLLTARSGTVDFFFPLARSPTRFPRDAALTYEHQATFYLRTRSSLAGYFFPLANSSFTRLSYVTYMTRVHPPILISSEKEGSLRSAGLLFWVGSLHRQGFLLVSGSS